MLAVVQRQYDALLSAQRATQEGAFHEDNKPEGDKDMRATEASYLARGQAMRVEQLGDEVRKIAAWEPAGSYEPRSVEMFSVVKLEDEDGAGRTLLMAPGAGGTKVELDEGTADVVTLTSPMGRAVLRAEADDTIEVQVAGALREFEVVEVL